MHWEQPGRRHLGGGIERLDVAGEDPDLGQAASGRWLLTGPAEGERRGDPLGALRREEAGEAWQVAPFLVELEPDEAAHGQVLLDQLFQAAHGRTPGQGPAERSPALQVDLGIDGRGLGGGDGAAAGRSRAVRHRGATAHSPWRGGSGGFRCRRCRRVHTPMRTTARTALLDGVGHPRVLPRWRRPGGSAPCLGVRR